MTIITPLTFLDNIKKYQLSISDEIDSNISFNEISLSEVEIENAFLLNFISVKSKYKNVHFENIDLYSCIFVETEFEECKFKNVDFSKGNLNNIIFKKCQFVNCKFQGAEIMGAEIVETLFNNCSFRDIVFSENKIQASKFIINDSEYSVINDNKEIKTEWIFINDLQI